MYHKKRGPTVEGLSTSLCLSTSQSILGSWGSNFEDEHAGQTRTIDSINTFDDSRRALLVRGRIQPRESPSPHLNPKP